MTGAVDGTAPVAVVLDGSARGELGGKGAALDRLIRWGIPVPATGVVVAAAYRRFAAQPEVAEIVASIIDGATPSAEQVDVAFMSASVPDDVAEAITTVAATVGAGGHLAVRSSATVEDMSHASFAGQYRSLLHVPSCDPEAVLRAVRLVFASLWHPAPVAYRQRLGIDQRRAAMAVVLMTMVPARRAGVVFTVDPAGSPDMARLEAVEGLAESLVSGQETPTVTLLRRDGIGWDAPAEVAAAVRWALDIEARAGVAQDVEWAWDGDRVWVVQARPITTQAVESADDIDDPLSAVTGLDLTTAGIGEMLPGALPPLRWDLCSFLVEEAFRSEFADLGVGLDDLPQRRGLLRRVRGRAALDFGQLSTLFAGVAGADPARLEEQYFGSSRPSPAMPSPHHRRSSKVRAQWRAIRSRRRADLDAEIAGHAIDTLTSAPPEYGAMSDRALLAYHLRLVDLAARTMAAELGVSAEAAQSYRRLEATLAGLLGADGAARAAARLTTLTAARLHERRAARPGASAAVFAGPTWAEEGGVPEALPRPGFDDEDDPVEALRTVMRDAGLDDGLRAAMRLRSALQAMVDAADHLGRRESTKAALLALGGEVRRVHLEMGARLCARRSVLSGPAEVELLLLAELRAALLAGTYPAADVMARRRRCHERAMREGPLPSRFDGGHPEGELPGPASGVATGWAVSSGQYEGPAVVVRHPGDPFPAGAVLVAEATDPSWSPLFMRAGAIVLERGGPLSHAAILARELSVPAVTNVPGATARLGGHRVMVDGDRGIVAVLDGEEPS